MNRKNSILTITSSDGYVTMSLDSDGNLISLMLPPGTGEILAHRVPFINIRKSEALLRSCGARWSDPDRITVNFEGSKCQVTLKEEINNAYLAFEVEDISGEEPDELVLLDIPVTLDGLVGEWAGIVQNDTVAFGVQGLTWFTDAGAAKEDGNVRLRASADRRSGLVGARFAIFACPRKECLSLLERLEKSEPGLPYFTDDNGHWLRTSPQVRKPYMVVAPEGFDPAKALAFAQRGGFPFLYLSPVTWTKTWGHFEVHPEYFPGGEMQLVEFGRKAREIGVKLGFHTMSGAISGSDPYVSPVPDPRLAFTGSGKLRDGVEADASTMVVGDTENDFCRKNRFYTSATEESDFDTLTHGGAFRIGSEIIRCQSLQRDGDQVILRGCARGEYGTAKTRHESGEQIVRLCEGWAPGLFFPDVHSELLDEIAQRLADLANRVGFGMTAFDGLEGLDYDGMGGCNRFLYEVSRRWERPLIAEASLLSHYGFHALVRHCWGEETYDVRGDMELRSRYNNLPIYESHLLVPGLGWQWFKCASPEGEATTIDEIEYLFAKAAGFGGPCALSTSVAALENHGLTDQLLTTTQAWQTAIASGAFTDEQRERMRHKGTDFHLEQKDDSELLLTEQKWSKRHWLKIGSETVLPLMNPFHSQRPTLIVRCLSTFDRSDERNISVPIAGFEFAPETEGHNTPLVPAQVRIVPLGAGICISAARQADDLHIARSWAALPKPVDISKHRGMGLDVEGDGSGALLFIELKDVPGMIRQYYWRLDFTGRKWLELPNGEPSIEHYYEHAPWNARWDQAVKWFDYSKIGSIAVGLSELQPDIPVSCTIHSMQFLSEIDSPIDELVVQSASDTVRIPAKLTRDHYLRVEPDGQAAIYDKNWHRVAEIPEPVCLPVSEPGGSEWRLESASGAWINVRTCFSKNQ